MEILNDLMTQHDDQTVCFYYCSVGSPKGLSDLLKATMKL